MPHGKFSKKISLLFLRFSPDFRSLNIFAVTEHTQREISKKKFFQNVHLAPIRRVLNRFSKFNFL
jgi:hypothetical protein